MTVFPPVVIFPLVNVNDPVIVSSVRSVTPLPELSIVRLLKVEPLIVWLPEPFIVTVPEPAVKEALFDQFPPSVIFFPFASSVPEEFVRFPLTVKSFVASCRVPAPECVRLLKLEPPAVNVCVPLDLSNVTVPAPGVNVPPLFVQLPDTVKTGTPEPPLAVGRSVPPFRVTFPVTLTVGTPVPLVKLNSPASTIRSPVMATVGLVLAARRYEPEPASLIWRFP